MIKALASGAVLLFICLCIGVVEGSMKVFMEAAAALSSALIVLAVILSGSAVSGDRERANGFSETKDDRRSRFKWAQNFLWAAVPCLFVTMIIYFTTK